MKKFLFTFAAFMLLGLTAQAQHVMPALGFDQQEITVTPGADATVIKIMLLDNADNMAGAQWQLCFFDENKAITTMGTLEATNKGNALKPNWLYYVNGELAETLGIGASELVKNNYYRILLANLDGSDLFPEGVIDLCQDAGIEPCMYEIKVKTDASWTGEYMTLEMYQSDDFQCMWNWNDGAQADHLDQVHPMVLTIKNANSVPAEDPAITGSVVIGERNGYQVPVTVTDAPEGYVLTVTVNGEEVDVDENGYITLDENPAYGTYVVVATVTATGYKGELSDTETFVIAQQTAATPVIDITTGETGATISVENATSYEVIVNGVNKGQVNFVEKDWVAQHIVVNAYNEPEGYIPAEATAEADLTAKANNQLQGDITIGAVDKNGKVYVAYSGNEDVVLTATVDGEAVEIENGYIQLPDYGTYEIVVTATATEEHYDAKSETATRTWDAPKVYEVVAPTVEGAMGENGYVINVTNNDPYATVTLYVTIDGERKAYTEFPVVIPQTEEDQYISYYATATLNEAPEGYDEWENATTAVKTDWIDALPKEFQGSVVVNVDENGNVIAQYVAAEGEEVPADITITVDPETLPAYGTYDVTVTVSAEGYEDMVVTKSATWSAPVLEQTDAPGTSKANYVYKDVANGVYYNAYTVTITNTDEDEAVIRYRVGLYNEETGQYEYGEWMTYTQPINFTQEGVYMVEAQAKAEGKEWSNSTFDGFTVSVATSIEELFADKAIAGVRYFNMAGQEMQEANGICVTVYTFTDGTQVAVKVMK